MRVENVSLEDKQNPLVYIFSKVWLYSKGNRRNVVLFWSLFILANSCTLLFHPLLMSKIINTLQQQGVTRDSIVTLCKLLLLIQAVSILFWSMHGPARLIERGNGFKARASYRKFLLGGVMALPMDWHVDHHSGDTIDKVEKGTQALYASSVESFQVISGFVKLGVSYTMLAIFSPSAAVIVLGMTMVTIWITTRFDSVIIKKYRELNSADNAISETVYDTISNITTVIILRVERLVFDAIVAKIDRPFKLYQETNRLTEFKWFLTSQCCSAMTVLVLAAYFIQHLMTSKAVLIGSVYLLLRYLDVMEDVFYRFTGMYGEILIRKSRVANSEILTADFKPGSIANHVLPPSWQTIQIEDLHFSYLNTEGARLHLEDVSLSIRRGERIAIIGKSGGGKSTLLKLIRNLYDPDKLTLTVDDTVIPHGFDGISSDIALIPQEPEIFATTFRENITLGAEYSPEEIRHFTDMANCTDFIDELPSKLDTRVNEKGVSLSGGQKQRLALARGLLACKDKSIVLLDEPTSSVDVGMASLICGNIFNSFPDKSILWSIHSLHLLPMFDRICMFHNGRIIASGSLDELLESSPEFQAQWRQYMEGDDDQAMGK